VSFVRRGVDSEKRDFKLSYVLHIVGVTPRWPARSFIHFLNRCADGIFSGHSSGFGGGAGHERNIFSYHGALRIIDGILYRRDGALRSVIMRSLGALSYQTFSFVVSATPRLCISALCVSGGPTFGSSTFGGDQRDPGHLDPVAFFHEQRLRKHTTGVARTKTHRDLHLQVRPYLHNSKRARSYHRTPRAVEHVDSKMRIASPHLST
jgi:hypothetical protein